MTVSWTRSVGVVVPAFNAAATLDQALASIAGQIRAPDAVVVVDDGSGDATGEICTAWRDVLPIKLVTHAHNAGLAASRRTGIAHLDTDLVALLDADDVWLPDHLLAMLHTFETGPALITANALRWVPTRGLGRRGTAERYPVPPPNAQFEHLIRANFVFVGTVFQRTRYHDVGGFRDGFRGAEDWDLWLRMARAGVPIRACRQPTVLYRVHASSMSAGHVLIPSEIRVLEALLGDVSDPQVRGIIRQAVATRRARVALSNAYDHAREGRSLEARTSAVAAIRGGPLAVKARAVSVAIRPRWSVARRDALVEEPERQVTWP